MLWERNVVGIVVFTFEQLLCWNQPWGRLESLNASGVQACCLDCAVSHRAMWLASFLLSASFGFLSHWRALFDLDSLLFYL